MKSVFIFVILVFFMMPCFSQQDLLPVYPREINYNGDFAYYNGSLFTGLLVDEKTNAKLGEFKNGYKNGLFTEYYSIGKKKCEGKYTMGIKDGLHTEWYENGNKKSEINFVNGKYNEMFTEWYENGNKKNEIKYINGIKDGPHTQWYENGNKMKEVNYSNGQWNGMSTAWFKNGQKEYERKYIDGKSDGVHTDWNENGQKTKETTYKNEILIREDVYNNGVLQTSTELKTEYFPGGAKKAEGLLKNGKKEGQWKSWYEGNQKIHESMYYKNDTLTGEYISYDDNGKIYSKGNYLHGNMDGYWTFDGYDGASSNSKNEQGNYSNGKREGMWNINGEKVNFINGEKDLFYGKRIKDYRQNNLINNTTIILQFLSSADGHKKFICYYDGDQNRFTKESFEFDVVSSVYSKITGTKRFDVIQKENYQGLSEDTIFYILKCSNIVVNFKSAVGKLSNGKAFNGYTASISFSLDLQDNQGKNIDSKNVYLYSPENMVYNMQNDAYIKARDHKVISVAKVNNLERSVESFIDKNFPR